MATKAKKLYANDFAELGRNYVSLMWRFLRSGIYDKKLRANIFGEKTGEKIWKTYLKFHYDYYDKTWAMYKFWEWLGWSRQKKVLEYMVQYGWNGQWDWQIEDEFEKLGYEVKHTRL